MGITTSKLHNLSHAQIIYSQYPRPPALRLPRVVELRANSACELPRRTTTNRTTQPTPNPKKHMSLDIICDATQVSEEMNADIPAKKIKASDKAKKSAAAADVEKPR